MSLRLPTRCPHAPWLLKALVLGATVASAYASDKPRPTPPIKPAAEYPAHDAHPNEHVTLAADPCDDTPACPFFRLPYVSHGFLPVRVVVTNDRDESLQLDDVRIQFIPAEGEKEGAATDDDLNRRLFSRKQAEGTRIPLIPITIHHEPVDKKILNDDADFGFQSTVVPPHSTRAGYVFYDTRGVDDPVMKGAEVYVKMIHYTDRQGAHHELFGFTLPLDNFLATRPKPAGSKPIAPPKPDPDEAGAETKPDTKPDAQADTKPLAKPEPDPAASPEGKP